jgi:uncharacterized membrane protein
MTWLRPRPDLRGSRHWPAAEIDDDPLSGNKVIGTAEPKLKEPIGGQPMRSTPLLRRDENAIEARITIQRPLTEVFGFYRDFNNLPKFLGDVMAVEEIDPATSRWTIQGPFGIRASWTIRVSEERSNELIRYETVTAPALRTYWEIHFARGSDAGDTEVREVMKAPLGRLGRAALALIGKFPAEEVSANLHRLKEIMETGIVSDTRYAVPEKFAQLQN